MSHRYEEGGHGSCRECGMEPKLHRDFGEPALDRDVPDPQPCRNCVHYAHTGPCPDALAGYPKAKPCPCEVAA